MEQLQKIGSYFFSTHFFISLVAVTLSLETAIVLHQPFQHVSLYVLIFFATHFAYNIYYIKTKDGLLFVILSMASLLGMVVVLFYLPAQFYAKLLVIALATLIYMVPVFFSFKKNQSFTVQKLILLVFVWVATTFFLPVSIGEYRFDTLILLSYRIVLLSLTCLLFFIRDEGAIPVKRKAISTAYVLCFLHLLLAFLVIFFVQVWVGIIYFSMGILSLIITINFVKFPYSNLRYLILVDGIMFLQSFVILIIYFLQSI